MNNKLVLKKMQKLERLKPYKSERPLKTINKVRNILEEHDIFTVESHLTNEANFHSCHITFDNGSLGSLGISTNGKGMNREYSLASGYAEFLERMQNNAKIHMQSFQATKRYIKKEKINGSFVRNLEQEGLLQDFRFAPDEKFYKLKEAIEITPDIYKGLFNESIDNTINFIKDELKTDEIETIPFYHMNSNEVIDLPIRLIQLVCGTNGMCSGNDKKEAILQGITEIFERYAIREIYLKELSLPTISLEYFKGNGIYDRIKTLEQEKKYTFIIKDCSLGIGLPVIGAFIVDHENSTYTLHLGADPCPITALERCFTEVYQGGKSVRFKSLHYNTDDIFTFLTEDNKKSREWNKLNQMYKTIKDGTGLWPDSIFSEKESYPFAGFENPVSYSNESDMKYLLNILERNKFNLYVRDQSYLGFDSFYVYIPELSNLYNINSNDAFIINYQLKDLFKTIANLNNADEHNIKLVAEFIEKDYNNPSYNEKNIRQYFLANLNYKFVDMKPELFLVMLNYRIRNYEKAFYFLNKHLYNSKLENNINYSYLYAIAEFIKLKIGNCSDSEIYNRLCTLYSKQLATEVIKDMENPEKVFQYHKLPSCYDCDNCQVQEQCKFFELLSCYKSIRNNYVSNMINQDDLSHIFFPIRNLEYRELAEEA